MHLNKNQIRAFNFNYELNSDSIEILGLTLSYLLHLNNNKIDNMIGLTVKRFWHSPGVTRPVHRHFDDIGDDNRVHHRRCVQRYTQIETFAFIFNFKFTQKSETKALTTTTFAHKSKITKPGNLSMHFSDIVLYICTIVIFVPYFFMIL